MEMPVFPPSEAAKTRSGSIIARAPKTQSTMRKPVRPRAAVAAGSTQLAIVPGGAMTCTARWKPSLFGISAGRTDLMPVYVAAFVYESVLRSEEHTSELQSRLHLVCRLLLEKKKIRTH